MRGKDYLDVVAVGPLVPVPQQHVDPVDDARHPQHDHDPPVPLIYRVSAEAPLHVVVLAVAVKQGRLHLSDQDGGAVSGQCYVVLRDLVPTVPKMQGCMNGRTFGQSINQSLDGRSDG